MNSLISEEYRAQNAEMHARGNYGFKGDKWAPMVSQICSKVKTASILDYGAGQGSLARALPGLNVQNYDPAVPEIAEPPDPADLVVCTDVLEHIEPGCLNNVLDDLRRLTIKTVFLVIATRPAVKTLPDGRNAHLIVQDAQWWMVRLLRLWTVMSVQNVPGRLTFIGKAGEL